MEAMKIDDPSRREFYLNECAGCNWSSRQLERQMTTFYYERLLATQKEGRESVKNEIQKTEPKTDPDYILKDPYILEFLLELGKGFSFVARQKRITIDGDHYYVDLVFL
jgi:predicted nuclease of restriction endonuclease-like (RecB) superfamily